MSSLLQGKLDNQEIRQKISGHRYISGLKPAKKLIDSIIEQFWFHDLYNSFISDEVYLEYLLEYLDKEEPNTFNRYDFFRYFFDKIAKGKEDRAMLQQIAIDFEKRHSDAIAPDDYKKILERLEILNGTFDISWMDKNHLSISLLFNDSSKNLKTPPHEGLKAVTPSCSNITNF